MRNMASHGTDPRARQFDLSSGIVIDVHHALRSDRTPAGTQVVQHFFVQLCEHPPAHDDVRTVAPGVLVDRWLRTESP
jgi:hypothetical protein